MILSILVMATSMQCSTEDLVLHCTGIKNVVLHCSVPMYRGTLTVLCEPSLDHGTISCEIDNGELLLDQFYKSLNLT